MAIVYMYTFYNDLAINTNEENIKIKQSRDIMIHNAMIEQDFPNFPISEYDVGSLFPFFKEITRQNPVLNVVLSYNLNGNDSSCIIIRNNKIDMFATKQEAFNSIAQMLGGKYKFVTSPIIR